MAKCHPPQGPFQCLTATWQHAMELHHGRLHDQGFQIHCLLTHSAIRIFTGHNLTWRGSVSTRCRCLYRCTRGGGDANENKYRTHVSFDSLYSVQYLPIYAMPLWPQAQKNFVHESPLIARVYNHHSLSCITQEQEIPKKCMYQAPRTSIWLTFRLDI